jgi:2-keto-4-pentenoate hydratase
MRASTAPRGRITSYRPTRNAQRPTFCSKRTAPSRRACNSPKTFPHIEIADFHAVRLTARKVEGGRRVIGHKVGLTSKAMQATSQIDAKPSTPLLR